MTDTMGESTYLPAIPLFSAIAVNPRPLNRFFDTPAALVPGSTYTPIAVPWTAQLSNAPVDGAFGLPKGWSMKVDVALIEADKAMVSKISAAVAMYREGLRRDKNRDGE